jgi:hypothetical protein
MDIRNWGEEECCPPFPAIGDFGDDRSSLDTDDRDRREFTELRVDWCPDH